VSVYEVLFYSPYAVITGRIFVTLFLLLQAL